MDRFFIFCVTLVLAAGLLAAPGTVAAALDPVSTDGSSETKTWGDDISNPESAPVELTDKQKKRLAKLHDRLYKDHEALIQLYAEYGLITEEQKARKLEWLKKRHERIKANDYRPCPGKIHKHDQRQAGSEDES